MALRRILVGLDGSSLAEAILGTVRRLAGRLRAEVVLLHVTRVPEAPPSVRPGPAVDDAIARERVRAGAYLDRVSRELQEAGLTARTAVGVGEPAVEIVRHAERERIDLIALATHGRSGMQRWLHGSVADAVLHTTTTPLLLLRPTGDGAVELAEKPRVVVPLDGSSVAEAALSLAEELARPLDVPIVLLRAVEMIPFAFGGGPLGDPYVDYEHVLELLRDDIEQYLGRVAGELRARGLAVETIALVGAPADAIIAYARDYPGSLLVMTTHGRTGWRALALGSVARRVVLLAGGPVLVVRPAEARSKR